MSREVMFKKLSAFVLNKNFPKSFLKKLISLAIIFQITALFLLYFYSGYGGLKILEGAKELTYSAIAAASLGLCGYFCFNSTKTK